MRFRQIAAAIQYRRYLAMREENGRVSWLARSIATFVAGGYMVDGDNPAVEKAQQLAYDDVEAKLVGYEPKAAGGGPIEPRQGSFERLMQFAGGMEAKGQ